MDDKITRNAHVFYLAIIYSLVHIPVYTPPLQDNFVGIRRGSARPDDQPNPFSHLSISTAYVLFYIRFTPWEFLVEEDNLSEQQISFKGYSDGRYCNFAKSFRIFFTSGTTIPSLFFSYASFLLSIMPNFSWLKHFHLWMWF